MGLGKNRPAIHGRDHRRRGEDPIGLTETDYVRIYGDSLLPTSTGPVWDWSPVPVISEGNVVLNDPDADIDNPIFDLTDPDSDEGIVILRTGLYLVWHGVDWTTLSPGGVVNFRAVSYNSRNEDAGNGWLSPGAGNQIENVRPDNGETDFAFQLHRTGQTTVTPLGSFGNSGGGTSQGGGSDKAHLGIRHVHDKGSDAHVYWEIIVARIGDLGFDV